MILTRHYLYALCLLLLSTSSFAVDSDDPTIAKKIIITGNPVFLDERGGVFMIPKTYITRANDGNYVTLENVRHVCYVTAQPNLSVLTKKLVWVDIEGGLYRWICYRFDPNYFNPAP